MLDTTAAISVPTVLCICLAIAAPCLALPLFPDICLLRFGLCFFTVILGTPRSGYCGHSDPRSDYPLTVLAFFAIRREITSNRIYSPLPPPFPCTAGPVGPELDLPGKEHSLKYRKKKRRRELSPEI